MSDFAGKDVNAVLRLVTSLSPGIDGDAGNRQLSILATALCVAARDCGIERDHFIGHLANTYDDMLARKIVPLHGAG